MIYRLFLIIVSLLGYSSNLSAISSIEKNDTSIIISLKHGELRIDKKDSSGYEWSYIRGTIQINSEILQECEDKKISRDVIILEFIPDSNCKVISIQIQTQGKIESFNRSAEIFCKELLDEIILGKISGILCEKTRIPLNLQLL